MVSVVFVVRQASDHLCQGEEQVSEVEFFSSPEQLVDEEIGDLSHSMKRRGQEPGLEDEEQRQESDVEEEEYLGQQEAKKEEELDERQEDES